MWKLFYMAGDMQRSYVKVKALAPGHLDDYSFWIFCGTKGTDRLLWASGITQPKDGMKNKERSRKKRC